MKKVIIAVALLVSGVMGASAQSKGTFAVGADLVSSYVWRGVVQDVSSAGVYQKGTPNFQPSLSYTYGGLTLGVWGSTAFTGGVKEVDVYATYVVSPLFSVTVTDYNWNSSAAVGTLKESYFEYAKDKTGHVLEASLNYAGTSSLPLSVSLNTMFYGADKKASDATKQAYSTYYELGYPLADNAKLFVGGTVGESVNYGTTGFAVSNVGVKVSKSLVISDKFSLPVYGVFGLNPAAESAFFVAGVTF